MVCGFLPFEDPKTNKLYQKILNAEYSIPDFVSSSCQDLIRKVLYKDILSSIIWWIHKKLFRDLCKRYFRPWLVQEAFSLGLCFFTIVERNMKRFVENMAVTSLNERSFKCSGYAPGTCPKHHSVCSIILVFHGEKNYYKKIQCKNPQ